MPHIARIVLFFIGALGCAQAWDYEGHRLVNQLALASLPTNYPAFVRLPAPSDDEVATARHDRLAPAARRADHSQVRVSAQEGT